VTILVAMIAAVAENGVIGNGNAIPWRIPSDFAHFKATTMGKPLILGRKTFESIGKPLPGRTNIVISRRQDYRPDGVVVVPSLGAALERAQFIAEADGAPEVMIGGGAAVYAEAMPLAKRLYISHVALSPEGDAVFPPILPAEWEDTGGIAIAPNPRDSAAFRVRIYERREPPRR
jgi:dihydrofolate reductase